MIGAAILKKILNIIAIDGSRLNLNRYTINRINIVLIAIMGVTLFIFLLDTFIFKDSVSEISIDAQIKKPSVEPVGSDVDIDMNIGNIKGDVKKKRISVEEVKANLNILGIITGDNNQVIIEDKNLKKTFFLYKGDTIGELKVYDIKDNMVIFECDGEKIELSI